MKNSVQYIGVDNLYWFLCYILLLLLLLLLIVLLKRKSVGTVVCISIRRKRADFRPNTFQSSSVVADQRHVVFVVKNHNSTHKKTEN